MTEQEQWETTWIEAYIRQCGESFRTTDDPCDCRQPRIDRITPDREAGYPRIHRQVCWSGTFRSDPEPDDTIAQHAELKAEAERYGVMLDENHYGRRTDPKVELPDSSNPLFSRARRLPTSTFRPVHTGL